MSFVYRSQTIPEIVQYNYIIIAGCQPIWASTQIYVINMDFFGAKMRMPDISVVKIKSQWQLRSDTEVEAEVVFTGYTNCASYRLFNTPIVNYWQKSYQHCIQIILI